MLHEITAPAIIAHGYPDVCRALRTQKPFVLLSAPGAALYAGALWWRELVTMAMADAPDLIAADCLDCGDVAGRAMAALRAGCRWLVLAAETPARNAVVMAASTLDACISDAAPPALDMADRDADRRLASWLDQSRTG